MYMKLREPVNSMSHFIGLILSLTGLVFLMIKSVQTGSPVSPFSVFIFGLSLILLYSSSCVYHGVVSGERVIRNLRKTDHCMIYILIAGTYTPICLITLKGTMGTVLFVVIWGLAILGIVFKLVWFDAPRWLYTLFYLALGWVAIFFIYPISRAMPGTGVFLLILGGIFYSGGAVIYALKPKKLKILKLGFHEIFHLFILAGSISHYLFVYYYVLS